MLQAAVIQLLLALMLQAAVIQLLLALMLQAPVLHPLRALLPGRVLLGPGQDDAQHRSHLQLQRAILLWPSGLLAVLLLVNLPGEDVAQHTHLQLPPWTLLLVVRVDISRVFDHASPCSMSVVLSVVCCFWVLMFACCLSLHAECWLVTVVNSNVQVPQMPCVRWRVMRPLRQVLAAQSATGAMTSVAHHQVCVGLLAVFAVYTAFACSAFML
jgi:hypothetical protein